MIISSHKNILSSDTIKMGFCIKIIETKFKINETDTI
jgi:hypothetical protein